MTDPLKDLVVDEASFARDELARALKPYVQLGREGGLWLLEPFDGLPARAKVICVLLAVKAQYLLDFRATDGAQPQELVDLSRMAAGTVRPKLSELNRSRLVAKTGSGYTIPDPMSRRALAELTGSAR